PNTKIEEVDRALWLCHAIRREAALLLGQRHSSQHLPDWGLWKDEYYFALAVYGLGTARWRYCPWETIFALVSAGMAAAQLSTVDADSRSQRERLESALAATPGWQADRTASPFCSYRVPLACARKLFDTKQIAERQQALTLMEFAVERYSHA